MYTYIYIYTHTCISLSLSRSLTYMFVYLFVYNIYILPSWNQAPQDHPNHGGVSGDRYNSIVVVYLDGPSVYNLRRSVPLIYSGSYKVTPKRTCNGDLSIYHIGTWNLTVRV